MTLNVWLTVAVAGGAIAGLGCYLLIAQFVPSTPALGPALRRLHPSLTPANVVPEPVRDPWSLGNLASPADLNILNRTAEQHLLSIGMSAGLGLALPVLLAVASVVGGFSVPFVVPVAASLLLAMVFGLTAHYDLTTRAAAARTEFVRALCTYAALTAHQIRSGHGAVEAMERSASVCDGWPYVRLRTALLASQLQMRPPWDELKELAVEIKVVELESFADIMRSAGADGAQVYQTMRAQAASLRDLQRVKDLERAKTRTSKLDIPATAMIIVVLVLVGYPMMVNLFRQT